MTLGNGREVETSGWAPKLPQEAVCFEAGLLGLLALSTAITLAVSVPPPSGLDMNAYFVTLSGVFFGGVTQVTASVWAANDGRRFAAARKLVRASLIVPLVVAVGISVASLLH